MRLLTKIAAAVLLVTAASVPACLPAIAAAAPASCEQLRVDREAEFAAEAKALAKQKSEALDPLAAQISSLMQQLQTLRDLQQRQPMQKLDQQQAQQLQQQQQTLENQIKIAQEQFKRQETEFQTKEQELAARKATALNELCADR